MLAIFLGYLTLLIGFAVLLLPLLLTELSRPRDAVWGAVILLLGLALINCSDRLNGSPMVMVLLGAFLISRLGSEIAQSRWHQLGSEEKLRFGSIERWTTGIGQIGTTLGALFSDLAGSIKIFRANPSPNNIQKKWIRPETDRKSEVVDKGVSNANDVSQSLKDVAKKQPQETFEGHRASQDS